MDTILLFLALVVTSATLFIQRQHNRKQVLPLLHTYLNKDYQDGLIVVELRLYNDGLGPAILQGVSIDFKGKVHEVENFEELDAVLKQNLPELNIKRTSLPLCLKSNSVEVLCVAHLTEEQLNQFNRDTFNITITATSVYEDKIVVDNFGATIESTKNDAFFEKCYQKIIGLFKK
ncbi:hypothetical protein [Vibrio sp. V39_P1S14PM300]|uniref:hypothetical protein n=1 Tax=Vibrio sp. V39_P1S14PM300 TaxID=1938690 RepID=UPI0013730492|nr:hypothetical protein [Vibrio sp. V39_P1S14PM300]NAX20823.1 hypothetical protein [Vibrio sp. V39_P1S14PM300]